MQQQVILKTNEGTKLMDNEKVIETQAQYIKES